MSSETTWTLEQAKAAWDIFIETVPHGMRPRWADYATALSEIAARRSQPEVDAVPTCPPWCGSGEVPPLGALVYVREAPRGTGDPHGWYASEECRASNRCLHPADRAKAKGGESGVDFDPDVHCSHEEFKRRVQRARERLAMHARKEQVAAEQPAAPPGFRVVGKSGPGTAQSDWHGKWAWSTLPPVTAPRAPFLLAPGQGAFQRGWNAGEYLILEPIADPLAPVADEVVAQAEAAWEVSSPEDKQFAAESFERFLDKPLPPAAPAVPQPGVPSHDPRCCARCHHAAHVNPCQHDCDCTLSTPGGTTYGSVAGASAAVQGFKSGGFLEREEDRWKTAPDALSEARAGRDAWIEAERRAQAELTELRSQAVKAEQFFADRTAAHERQVTGLRDDNDRLQREVVRLGNERDARDIRIDELVRFLEVRAKVLVAMEKQLDNRDARIADLETTVRICNAAVLSQETQLNARDARIAGLEASSADLVRRAQEAEARALFWEGEAKQQKENCDAMAQSAAELRGKLERANADAQEAEASAQVEREGAIKHANEVVALLDELADVKRRADELAELTTDVIRDETRVFIEQNPDAKCVHCQEMRPRDDFDHWRTCEKHPANALVAELRGKLAAAVRERDEAVGKERARCLALIELESYAEARAAIQSGASAPVVSACADCGVISKVDDHGYCPPCVALHPYEEPSGAPAPEVG